MIRTISIIYTILYAPLNCFADRSEENTRVKICDQEHCQKTTDGKKSETSRYLRSRIFNGNDSKKNRFPYMVSSEGSGFLCGGILIADNIVLSAAHCEGAFVRAAVGKQALSDWPYLDYESIQVAAEISHPDFDVESMKNDLMIVVLSTRSDTAPACTASGSMELVAGDGVAVLGFGETEFGLNSQHLQIAEMEYITNAACQETYAQISMFEITESMMCATSELNMDACQGDSGGPLLRVGQDAVEDVVVGIVSWGIGCGIHPGVFTSISNQRNWINDRVRQYGGNMPACSFGEKNDASNEYIKDVTRPSIEETTPVETVIPTNQNDDYSADDGYNDDDYIWPAWWQWFLAAFGGN
mmetsp:Transcript_19039/g.43354  ORF Transcript_19039/g.43354 Transcript_19039/m.43354 type:complete len:356 (-) Transcript_19039:117-1184(-)